MTEDHSRTPLPELEALLRGGGLPPERRRAIEAELNRRYAEKWRSSTAPAPPPGLPPAGPAFTPPVQPPAWGPPPVPAPVPAAKPSGPAKPLGCLAAILVAALVGVVIAIVVDSGSSPPPIRTGTVCVTQLGTCPMAESLPVGASCVCRTPNGDIGGVVD